MGGHSVWPVYFYEIHEGDEEIGTAVLVGHEQRIEPMDFFELVKRARALIVESYEEDSLAEAIANELQRASGFVHVTDELVVASVHVDEREENTYLVTEGRDERTVYLSREENGESRDGEEEREN